MKTLFLGAVAALLLSLAAANATTHVINFDGQCDVYTLTAQFGKKAIWSVESMGTGCNDGFGFGGVSKATSLGPGEFISMGMVLFASGDADLYTLQLQYPLVTGNAWYVFESIDGVNFTEVNSGTYTVTEDPSIHAHGKPAILDR